MNTMNKTPKALIIHHVEELWSNAVEKRYIGGLNKYLDNLAKYLKKNYHKYERIKCIC